MSLAGVFQSSYLVQKLAYSGKCNELAFKTCLESILTIDSSSVISIYGEKEKNLSLGLKILISILTISNFCFSYFELIKYILKIINIEKKIKDNYIVSNVLKKKY